MRFPPELLEQTLLMICRHFGSSGLPEPGSPGPGSSPVCGRGMSGGSSSGISDPFLSGIPDGCSLSSAVRFSSSEFISPVVSDPEVSASGFFFCGSSVTAGFSFLIPVSASEGFFCVLSSNSS